MGNTLDTQPFSHTLVNKMVHIPDSLCWQLVKKNNCFIKRRGGGRTARLGYVEFNVEKGNLANLNKPRFSGLANSKAVDISPTTTETGAGAGITMNIKVASKAHSYPKQSQAVIPLNKHFRRSVKAITNTTIDNYYRKDLKSTILARYSAVYRSSRIARGIKKPIPVKRGRVSK